tara:strand:+ start:7710 stop:8684 length:975 start_codon:yes stop_codon:yes gene_type:complete
MTDSNETPLFEKRATSQKSEEQEANPYNQKKDYLDYDSMDEASKKPFADSNTIAYKKPSPKTVVDTSQVIDNEEETKEEANVETQPYKKVDYKKRYDDLKRHYDDKVNSFKQKEEELHAQLRANRPQYKAPKSKEELQEFKKNYPDVYDVVESVAHTQATKEMEDLKSEIKSLREKNTEISKKEAEATLSRLHPDFNTIRESDEFHQWADSQPEEIKGWIYSNATNATLASRAIDLFKQDVGKSTKSTKETSGDLLPASEMIQVRNSKEVGYGSKKIWTRSQIAAMSQSEFDKNEQSITEAMTDGRVVDDLGRRNYGGSGNPTY